MDKLEQAKQTALDAKKALLLPKYIKSADAELCWQGRILRGMDLGGEAMSAGDKDKVEVIRLAIQQVEKEMDIARETATDTEKAYRALGGTEALDVGECNCFYCERNKRKDSLWVAESRLRRAVFNLTEPDDCGKPLPLCYMNERTEEGQKKAWSLFMELCNAQANYLAACTQANQMPAWGYILRAW